MASWFDGLKNNLLLRKQRQQAGTLTHLARRLLDGNAAKTAALLYNATNENERIAVWAYAKKLAEAGKKVQLLGYLDAAEMPADLLAQSQRFVGHERSQFFCQKDLNWAKIPQGDGLKQFAAEPSDWLLCLYTTPQPQLDFLAASAAAAARIGRYHDDEAPHLELAVATTDSSLQALITAVHQILFR
jgi:hypothetical protein